MIVQAYRALNQTGASDDSAETRPNDRFLSYNAQSTAMDSCHFPDIKHAVEHLTFIERLWFSDPSASAARGS